MGKELIEILKDWVNHAFERSEVPEALRKKKKGA